MGQYGRSGYERSHMRLYLAQALSERLPSNSSFAILKTPHPASATRPAIPTAFTHGFPSCGGDEDARDDGSEGLPPLCCLAGSAPIQDLRDVPYSPRAFMGLVYRLSGQTEHQRSIVVARSVTRL